MPGDQGTNPLFVVTNLQAALVDTLMQRLGALALKATGLERAIRPWPCLPTAQAMDQRISGPYRDNAA